MELDKELGKIIEREVGALGYELVKLEAFFVGRRKVLRAFIDRSDGVTIDDCVRATKALNIVLDGLESIPGPYNLEVSSPGDNRPLTKPEHFERFRGERSRVEYRGDGGERTTERGTILGADLEGVTLEVDGAPRRILFGSVIRANLEPSLDGRARSPRGARERRRSSRGETL